MTKSEIDVLKSLYGYRNSKGDLVPPTEVPNPDGLIVGGIVQKNTRWHVAAIRLEKAGLADIFTHKEDDKLRLVVPAYR